MKVLVFMTGSLGDTLAAVPALWSIRRHWPKARLMLLSDAQQGDSRITPKTILDGAGLIDEFLHYPVTAGSRSLANRLTSAFSLWRVLRRAQPDVLVYLVRAFQGDPRVRRDLGFFRLAGVPSVVGASTLPELAVHPAGSPMPNLPRLADLHLQQIAADGVAVPCAGEGNLDLALNESDHAAAAAWMKTLPPDGGRRWVAFGVGSKMPAKLWPAERYEELGQRLMAKHDVWPIIFGGAEDVPLAEKLVVRWGRGAVAAGKLGIRASAAALSRCALYVGNDTGTMHLAAAVGVHCVAIFSARDYRGLWEPYGIGHVVLREDVPCAGCREEVCPIPSHPCISQVPLDRVEAACRQALLKL